MTNSADPDQLASEELIATLIAKTGHVVFSMRRVKLKKNTVDSRYLELHGT